MRPALLEKYLLVPLSFDFDSNGVRNSFHDVILLDRNDVAQLRGGADGVSLVDRSGRLLSRTDSYLPFSRLLQINDGEADALIATIEAWSSDCDENFTEGSLREYQALFPEWKDSLEAWHLGREF